MFKSFKNVLVFSSRSYKNFGHKPQPTATVTTLWHGFLTFTFIGMTIEWKRIAKYLFGTTIPESRDLYTELPTAENDGAK